MRAIKRFDTPLWIARRHVERVMNSKVRIGRMDHVDDQDDPTKPSTTKILRTVYCGPARLYSLAGGGGPQEFGDGLGYMSSSYISIPLTDQKCWTQVDDMIEVLGHPDPDTVGRVFRVMDVDGGGQFPVVRRHTVTSIQRSPQWTWPAELIGDDDERQ